jgi:hypothetical protein
MGGGFARVDGARRTYGFASPVGADMVWRGNAGLVQFGQVQ